MISGPERLCEVCTWVRFPHGTQRQRDRVVHTLEKVKHMTVIDTETVTGKLGEYTIKFLLDEYPTNPWEDWDHASSLAVNGRRRYLDAEYGDLADEVLLAAQRGHSEAALVRWLRLKGATGIQILTRSMYDGSMAIDSGAPSTEFGMSVVDGLVFLAPGVAEKEQIADAEAFTTSEAEDYFTWASGDVFGYIVECEDGEELDVSCWGYYGMDRNRDYVVSEGKAAIEAYEAEKIEAAEVEAYDEQGQRDDDAYEAQLAEWVAKAATIGERYRNVRVNLDEAVPFDIYELFAEVTGRDYLPDSQDEGSILHIATRFEQSVNFPPLPLQQINDLRMAAREFRRASELADAKLELHALDASDVINEITDAMRYAESMAALLLDES